MAKDHAELWPMPHYECPIEPHFFFVATPPNSGSTVLALLLNTSPHTVTLSENAEAQWMVPGLKRDHRWMASMKIDTASIRACWMAAFSRQYAQNPQAHTVIEKSPPNLVRMEQIASAFPRHSIMVNNRDPYANAASIGYRYFDFDTLGEEARIAQLRKIIDKWQMRSRHLRSLVQAGYPLMTYEAFCANPRELLDKVDLPDTVKATIDFGSSVVVKDYGSQTLSNQNARQTDMLSRAEIAAITEELARDPALVQFFDYELR